MPEARGGKSTALGNALNAFAHVVLYGLVSGRQPVVGRGRVNALMCGPAGAFECGLPYHTDIDVVQRTTMHDGSGGDGGGSGGGSGGSFRRGGSAGAGWDFASQGKGSGRRRLPSDEPYNFYAFRAQHMIPVHSWDHVYNQTHDVHEG